MPQFDVTLRNASYALVSGPDDVLDALEAAFTANLPLPPPQARNPFASYTYQAFQRGTHRVGVGLLSAVQDWAKTNRHTLQFHRERLPARTAYGWPQTPDWLTEDRQTALRPVQITALKSMSRSPRGIIIAPTGTGKSRLIAQALTLSFEQREQACVLILVPTLTLIGQMRDVLRRECAPLLGREVNHRDALGPGKYLVTTWHHLARWNKKGAVLVSHVLVDEAHTTAARKTQTILGACINAYVRWGFTGTVPDQLHKQLKMCRVLGPMVRVATTQQLVEKKILAQVTVQPIRYRYEPMPRGHSRWTFQDEYRWIVSQPGRLKQVLDIAAAHPNDRVLVLCQWVETHATPLYELMQRSLRPRPVFFISGQTEDEQRDWIRGVCVEHPTAVLVGTYPTLQAGVDWPRLNVIILASGTKSSVRVLQSIGRGLRRIPTKTETLIYDLSDQFKYSRRHAVVRADIYAQEGFTVQPVQEVVIN